MKLLIIGTSVYALPPQGYSGLEMLCYHLAEGLGHQVTIVAPEGSRLSEGIEVVPTPLREDEEKSWLRYRGRLEAGEFDVILDASWQRWAMMSSVGKDPGLPIVNWHHTDPSVYGNPGPVQYPMWVGLSRDHAERLSRHMQVPVRWIYNGIDMGYYRDNGKPRGERWLWVGRWTAEKGAAEVIGLAQKLRVPVDMYGDTEIIGPQEYMKLCQQRADGYFARWNPGISREMTVDAYSTHRGLLFWPLWEEPFGLVPIEAMACGCVPIVRRSGALPELIEHGETGFLCDTLEEVEELVKGDVVKGIDPEVMRVHVEKRFGLERFVGDWEALLQRVADGERW